MVCLTLSAHWTSKKIPIERLSKSTIQPINSDRSEVDDFTSGYCGEICGYLYDEARILQVSSLTTDRPDQPQESQSAEDPTGYRRKVLSQTYMIAKCPSPSLRLLRLLDLLMCRDTHLPYLECVFCFVYVSHPKTSIFYRHEILTSSAVPVAAIIGNSCSYRSL